MRSDRDSRPYLQDMLDSIVRIQKYTHEMEVEDFLADDILKDAVVRRIEIIGEAAGKIQ